MDNDNFRLQPTFSNLDAAWRSFIRSVPELDDTRGLQAFVAGATAALSIIHRCGFANLNNELNQLQQEFEEFEENV